MIPDAAMEAAAKALRDRYAAEVCELPVESFLEDARLVLEAAAAYLQAAAWLEGYNAGELDGALQLNGHEPPDERNPYRTGEVVETDLTELARLLLKDAYELQSHPGTKDVCQHLTDAAIALDKIARGLRDE